MKINAKAQPLTIGNKGKKCKEIIHFDSGSKKGTEEGSMLGSSSAYGCAALSRLPCKRHMTTINRKVRLGNVREERQKGNRADALVM
jgi:hypothetical protein